MDKVSKSFSLSLTTCEPSRTALHLDMTRFYNGLSNPISLQEDVAHKFNVEEFGSQSTFESAVQPFFQDESKWLVILVPPKWHKLLSYMRFHLQSSRRDTTLVKHVIIITQLLRNSVRYDRYHSFIRDLPIIRVLFFISYRHLSTWKFQVKYLNSTSVNK